MSRICAQPCKDSIDYTDKVKNVLYFYLKLVTVMFEEKKKMRNAPFMVNGLSKCVAFLINNFRTQVYFSIGILSPFIRSLPILYKLLVILPISYPRHNTMKLGRSIRD